MQTMKNSMRPIHRNNPGALTSYQDVDYNDGYQSGIAQYRTERDGVKALVVAIYNTYRWKQKRTLRDFTIEWVSLAIVDPLAYMQAIWNCTNGIGLAYAEEDLNLTDPVLLAQMVNAIAAIENGPVVPIWKHKPYWIDQALLEDVMIERGII